MAGIAYAQQDEEKTVRPMAHAGFGSGYLEKIALKLVGHAGGARAGGDGDSREPDLRDCGYGE